MLEADEVEEEDELPSPRTKNSERKYFEETQQLLNRPNVL